MLLIATALLAASQVVSAACTDPSIRKPWTALTELQRESYVNATLCLMDPDQAPARVGSWGARSRWEELLVAHIAQVRYIHTVGALFPWHRWYTKIHEDLLRNECAYVGPYPYWDEQADQAINPIANASVWDHPSSNTSGVPVFGTGRTDENSCILDGAFKNYRVQISTHLERSEPGACLTRALNQTAFDTVSQKNVVEPCMAVPSDDYAQMLGCLGNSPHSGGHLGVGGIMRDHARSPVDPIFWLHHTNFDRLWWEWQSANLSARLYAMGGPNVANGQIFIDAQPAILPIEAFVPYFGDDGKNTTTLNHVLWMPGLAENITIRDAMDIRSDLMCFSYA
ncbi:Tyrosinase-like protein orsC [Colletotrichum orbiculare MAFF 240422]|uniref:Tyrosinase-like protein orsC n=1 Tax=Colletotrichum orbiculare (strain 104-T / ATCC 96160 / CBS 514.97 / LARS 414 / MAFF 240422) TaxID=1213857 RepID=A0A484FQK8_COLOR|nr:Tyrosinase-like protein orsC [Colletotrichum orbiculare MAFF 240422]